MSVQTKVQTLAAECLKKHADLTLALNELEQKVSTIPEFEELKRTLIRVALRQVLHRIRHASNREIKRRNSMLFKQQQNGNVKVVSVASQTVNLISDRIADSYFLGGKRLGDLFREDLASIAERERASAEGHLFNAVLCERLIGMLPENQNVRQAVNEQTLRKLFRQLQKERLGGKGVA